MSSLSSKVLAAKFLPSASSSCVVDFFLEKADYDQVSERPASFRGVWSASSAKRSIRGPLARACAVAAHPGTDPDVLAAFVRDSRVSVRHALLANPAVPYDAVKSLGPWALERQDQVAMDSVVSRLTPEDLVDLLASMPASQRAELVRYRSDYLPAARIARKCLSSRQTALRAASLSWYALAEAMTRLLSRRDRPVVSLTELVEQFPEVFRGDVVAAVFSRSSTLTCEMVTLAVRFPPKGAYRLEPGDSVVLIEPGALEILAGLGRRQLEFAVVNGLDEAAIGDMIPDADVTVLETLVSCMSKRRFGASLEKAIARRLIEVGGDIPSDPELISDVTGSVVGEFVRSSRYELPRGLLLELLRHGSYRSSLAWLNSTSKAPNGVTRPGLLTELLADPQFALARVERTYSSVAHRYEWVLKHSEDSTEWLVAALRGRPVLAESLDFRVRLEVTRLVDQWIPAQLTSPGVVSLVMPILESAFGDNLQQWETFLTLATDWSGGFSDLVDATCALTGIPALVPDSEVIASPACQELTLT